MASSPAASTLVLPASRNILAGAGFDSTQPLYRHLCGLLGRNATARALKSGPSHVFHNHNAAHLTAAFRFGASATQLDDILGQDPDEAPRVPAGDAVITAETWTLHLGGFGLLGLGLEPTYWRYRVFFADEVARLGPHGAVREYFPRLSSGLAADFFHAIIELGYWAESGDASLCISGLAWLAAGHVELPSGGAHEPLRCGPIEALRQLESTPKFDLNNGSTGYVHDMEMLVAEHSDVVLRCDVEVPPARTQEVLLEMCQAALLSFEAGGCVDFYTLHSVTGSRAVWALFRAMAGHWAEHQGEVEAAALGTLWRAIIFTHAARNNPTIRPTLLPLPAIGGPSRRPWSAIVDAALVEGNVHIVKLLFTCAAFQDAYAEDLEAHQDIRELYHHVADSTLRVREGGAPLEGVGVGNLLEGFLARL